MLELIGDGWSRRLGPRQELRFGRGGGDVELSLTDDPRLHRHCGTIVVGDDGWELRNTGRWLRLRIVSSDRFGVDSLSPGQSLRVPWPQARVQVFVAGACHEFTTRYHGRVPSGARSLRSLPPGDDLAADATMSPARINRSTGYYRALLALCEPQLLDPSTSEVATDLQIARRLNRTGRERGRLSGKTVERRLDHCRTRFGLKQTDELGLSSGLERRDSRRLLVEVALLTAVVTASDLSLLDPIDAAVGDDGT